MKKSRKILLSFILLLPLVVYLIANLTFVVKERYNIIGADVFLLRVEDTTKCTQLSLTKRSEFDTSSTYLIGVKMKFEYLSLEHENLYFDYTQFPRGNKGIVDTLQSIKLIAGSNKLEIQNLLENASEYKYFLLDSIELSDHSGTGHCYTAITNDNVDEMINEINMNKEGRITDVRFYKLPKKILKFLKDEELILKMYFLSDRVVLSNAR